METTNILALIPESLHEDLIKEVQALLITREKKDETVSPEIKNFVKNNLPTTKPKK